MFCSGALITHVVPELRVYPDIDIKPRECQVHHDFPLTKWEIPLKATSQFDWEPEPQSRGAVVPIWRGCRDLTPCFAREHLPPLGLHKLLHKQDIQARGHDKVFRIDHKSFSTQYLDFQRSFYPVYQCVPAPGAPPDRKEFLCRVDQAWDLYRKVTETNAFVHKRVLISNTWHFVCFGEKFLATSNLRRKLSWMFFAFGLCFILVHIDSYKPKRPQSHLRLLDVNKCNSN